MNAEEILEGNRLIAEFMGYVETDFNSHEKIFIKDRSWFQIKGCLYHGSWDWLMPVVEKIESLGLFTRIINLSNKSEEEHISPKHACEIADWIDREIAYCKSESKIEAVWLAVVGFIKQHNERQCIQQSTATKAQ